MFVCNSPRIVRSDLPVHPGAVNCMLREESIRRSAIERLESVGGRMIVIVVLEPVGEGCEMLKRFTVVLLFGEGFGLEEEVQLLELGALPLARGDTSREGARTATHHAGGRRPPPDCKP